MVEAEAGDNTSLQEGRAPMGTATEEGGAPMGTARGQGGPPVAKGLGTGLFKKTTMRYQQGLALILLLLCMIEI
ncbi:hypothetical protein EBH_0024530 [Eimeria brunetti]|uniref:Uncharacterized protein n=1 Tax=Eimeria brunetti TaxID=51314 RepID=U6LN07_9EIME|nr:hypothetical protein EBH_0024530 [Eimeria brunetti]